MTVRVGVAGLGHWGPNLARNFAELAELTWLCDSDPATREAAAARYPQAHWTASYDDMLADDALDAVVVATPVPTHFELARRALSAVSGRAPGWRDAAPERFLATLHADEPTLPANAGYTALERRLSAWVDGGLDRRSRAPWNVGLRLDELDDADGPSKKFMRTLRSKSVPFVSTIFRTWYTERLQPWLHYVPIDPRFQSLHTTYLFFTGTEDRQTINGVDTNMQARTKDGEYIAQQGQKWADQVLQQKDMGVYLFRLLLEWGRLIDDNREVVGFRKTDEGKLDNIGFSQGTVS